MTTTIKFNQFEMEMTATTTDAEIREYVEYAQQYEFDREDKSTDDIKADIEATVAGLIRARDEAFAETVENFNVLMPDALKRLGYSPEEVTENTYLYIDTAGQLAGIEKRDRNGYPEDELLSIGYVSQWDGGIADARADLHAVMTTAEVEAEFCLAPGTAQKAIRNGWLPARKSGGTWLIRRADAEKRWDGRKGNAPSVEDGERSR